ncbi:hypothetical protein Tco_0414505 [Tanacetum coccineum]
MAEEGGTTASSYISVVDLGLRVHSNDMYPVGSDTEEHKGHDRFRRCTFMRNDTACMHVGYLCEVTYIWEVYIDAESWDIVFKDDTEEGNRVLVKLNLYIQLDFGDKTYGVLALTDSSVHNSGNSVRRRCVEDILLKNVECQKNGSYSCDCNTSEPVDAAGSGATTSAIGAITLWAGRSTLDGGLSNSSNSG